jgi:AP endonuclease 2
MRLTTWNVNGIRNPFSYPPWNSLPPPGTEAGTPSAPAKNGSNSSNANGGTKSTSSVSKLNFPAMFQLLGADIIVMQELKIQRKDLVDDMVLLPGWDCYFTLPKAKKGYSGVAVYVRSEVAGPVRAEEGVLGVLPAAGDRLGRSYAGLPEGESIGGYPSPSQLAEIEHLGVEPKDLDSEGRCLVLEFAAFVLFGVYAPANSNGLRDEFRYAFHKALDFRIRNLVAMGKQVVLTGDLNVSRSEMDSASALEDMRKSGVTHEEYISTPNRRLFNQLLVDGEVVPETPSLAPLGSSSPGLKHADRNESPTAKRGILIDTTRLFHPARKGMYTHWEQKINARPGNYGSRIDYVLVSEGMREWVKDADIQEGLLGSDHCPVFVDFHDRVAPGASSMPLSAQLPSAAVDIRQLLNPPGTFQNGRRVKEWRLKDVPALSAKKLPEFDLGRRRSIKHMFGAPPPALKSSASASQSSARIPPRPSASGTAKSAVEQDAETEEKEDTKAAEGGEAAGNGSASLAEEGIGAAPDVKTERSDLASPTRTSTPTAGSKRNWGEAFQPPGPTSTPTPPPPSPSPLTAAAAATAMAHTSGSTPPLALKSATAPKASKTNGVNSARAMPAPASKPQPTKAAKAASAKGKTKTGVKGGNGSGNGMRNAAGGQQSLRGFFVPKRTADVPEDQEGGVDRKVDGQGIGSQTSSTSTSALLDGAPDPHPFPSNGTAATHHTPTTQDDPDPALISDGAGDTGAIDADEPASPTPSEVSAQLERTASSQASWNSLFTKPAAPLCEGHQEPCKSMQTKKKGVNMGRRFWMCARPLGPSGQKEQNSEWRCGTFIWASEWQGGGGGGGGGGKKDKGGEG